MINRESLTKGASRARQLLEDIGFDDITDIPLATIASFLGAIIIEEPMELADGKIIRGKTQTIIKINSTIFSEEKKRFTLAHEIGHFLLHNILDLHDDTSKSMNWFQHLENQAKRGKQEYEANDFAAELLMPERIFRNEFQGKKFSPDLLKELALRFRTSITSVIFRIFKLDLYPICIVYMHRGKVKYWLKSTDLYVYIKNINQLPPPEDSVAQEYIDANYEYLYSGVEKAQKINRSTWFELSSKQNDDSFFEYCIPYKAHKMLLSVIWEGWS